MVTDVKKDIIAVCGLISTNIFTQHDLSKPFKLDTGKAFDLVNSILKESYGYKVSKYTYIFLVISELNRHAEESGIILEMVQ